MSIKKTFSRLTAEQWRKEYENGTSLNDLSAHAAAKGLCISIDVIRRHIIEAGGAMRSRLESTLVKKHRLHYGKHFDDQHK